MEDYDESVGIYSDYIESDDDENFSVSGGHQTEDEISEDGDDCNDGNCSVESDAVAGEKIVKINSLTREDILGLEFGSVEEAYEFYYRYGKCKGFGVRKSNVRKTGAKGDSKIRMRLFVCCRQGLRNKKHLTRTDRKREHRRLTRTNCNARLRVKYDDAKARYVVSTFDESHNHELTPVRYVHLHPVFRKISEADKAQIDGLQSHGIRTCHIMGYMVAQKGGHAKVGFTRKDLYNYFDKKMCETVKDGDIEACLSYLNVKSSTDTGLYAECSVNEKDGRLKCLFWADGCSRSDYFCFGDVVAFDTTYKKNKYNYPLVVFSGCNHHGQTVIFGAALVEDETKETYKWVLNCFMDCVNRIQPKAVVTDGDGSMRDAVKHVFPDATHRLCSWHLSKNANENAKNSEFLHGFSKAMYSNTTPDQFEELWANLIKETKLEGHPWVAKTYKNKALWATAYLRHKFFGRFRTTSQCEAINAIIKTYVRKQGCIFEFMHNFDEAVRGYRNNEVLSDYTSKYTDPVLTSHLPQIEAEAAKIFTAEIFKDVRGEIMKAGPLIVRDKYEDGDIKHYKLKKYCESTYEREVVYDGDTFKCSCKLFETRGLPCSHIFYVMKEENVEEIPRSLVLSRWTKDAKMDYLNVMDRNGSVDEKEMEEARFSAYCSTLTQVCREAAKREDVYGEMMEDIMKLQKKYCITDDYILTQKSGVRDPKKVNSKGAPKKKKNAPKARRQCSICQSIDHDARICPVTKGTPVKGNIDSDSLSVSMSVADSISQNAKNKKRKTSSHGKTRLQKQCSGPSQNCGGNEPNTPYIDVTSRPTPPVYGIPGMMPVMHPVHPMQLQPMYLYYGMHVGESSNAGLVSMLKKVIDSAGNGKPNSHQT